MLHVANSPGAQQLAAVVNSYPVCVPLQAQDVLDASTKAFSTLLASQQQQQPPNPSAVGSALAALTVLKGVGPATASALLAAADASGSTPFMSDEALEAAVGSRWVH